MFRRDGGMGEVVRCFSMLHRGKRAFNIDPPTSPGAIMRRAQTLPRREQWTRRVIPCFSVIIPCSASKFGIEISLFRWVGIFRKTDWNITWLDDQTALDRCSFL